MLAKCFVFMCDARVCFAVDLTQHRRLNWRKGKEQTSARGNGGHPARHSKHVK